MLVTVAGAVAADVNINIDGKKDDWKASPLLKEIGGTGKGASGDGIDATQFYVENNAKDIYLFIGTAPSFKDRFRAWRKAGTLCYIYIETDNNLQTGCNGDFKGSIKGYEYRLWVHSGQTWGGKHNGQFLAYGLTRVSEDGEFPRACTQSKTSFEDKDCISDGDEGVELRISLESLGLKKGDNIKFVVVENTHLYDIETQSKTQYTIK